MKNIFHIIPHNLEFIYPQIKYNKNEEIKNLDHAVTRYIYQLIKRDNKKEFNHILIVLCNTLKENRLEINHKNGYKIIILKSYGKWYPLEISFQLKKEIKKINGNDIIHIHGTGSFIFDQISSNLKNKKTIIHYRGGHFTWKSFPISFIKYYLFQPFSLLSGTKFFIENKKEIERYKSMYGIEEKKLIYIPGAIDLDFYQEYEREQNKKTINILFVGRLDKAKGTEELMKVWNIVDNNKIRLEQKTGKKIGLTIVGDGKEKGKIKKWKENNGINNVEITGHVSQEMLKGIYKESDIFVLPTHSDSFGLVIIEAMVNSLPIISTFTDGPMDIVEIRRNGYLFSIKDGKKGINNFYNYLEKLILNDDLRNFMGKKSLSIVKEKYNWDKVYKKIFKEYRKI